MALLNSPCGCGSVQPTVIVYDDGSAPPTIGNVVALQKPGATRPWAGTAGPGIAIVQPFPDTAQGMQPTISVALSPVSPVPLTFDAAGRISAGPVDVEGLQTAVIVNGGAQVQGGLQVTQTGVKGHSLTVAVRASAQSSGRVWIGNDGGLAVDPPLPFVWEVVNAAGNTRTVRLRNTVTGNAITLGTV